MNSKRWQALKAGDRVDIVAPGYRSTREELDGAVRFLESWGLVPRLPKKIFGRDLLCSNNDEQRFEHLAEALMARDSQAIWCLRGGYGSNRLIPYLMKLDAKRLAPKLFIGLSDITTLHVFLGQSWGWPTIHGPLLDRLGRKAVVPKYEREMKGLVFGDFEHIHFGQLIAMNDAASKSTGVLQGRVSGGNMIVLQSTLGTSSSWQTRDRFLFFEDIGERAYRIDRVLEQFSQAGLFDRAKGILFGEFTGGDESDGRNLILPCLKRFALTMKIPVYRGFPCGHGKVQRPLPFETPCELKLGERGELMASTGVVSLSRRRSK